MSPSSRYEDLVKRTENLCAFHLQGLSSAARAMRSTGPPTSNQCDVEDCRNTAVIRIFPRQGS